MARSPAPTDRWTWQRAGLWFVRYGIGLVLIVGGIVAAVAGGPVEIGMMAVGGGIGLIGLNAVFRLGAQGDLEREREEEARRYFDRHGRWPDEAAPAREPQPREQTRGSRAQHVDARGRARRSAGQEGRGRRRPG
jgi:hypothetical protein